MLDARSAHPPGRRFGFQRALLPIDLPMSAPSNDVWGSKLFSQAALATPKSLETARFVSRLFAKEERSENSASQYVPSLTILDREINKLSAFRGQTSSGGALIGSATGEKRTAERSRS